MKSLFIGLIAMSTIVTIFAQTPHTGQHVRILQAPLVVPVPVVILTSSAQVSTSVNTFAASVQAFQSTSAKLQSAQLLSTIQAIAALTPIQANSVASYLLTNLTSQLTVNATAVLAAQYNLIPALAASTAANFQSQSYDTLTALALAASTAQNSSTNTAQWATATIATQQTLGAYNFYNALATAQVKAKATLLVYAQAAQTANPMNQTVALLVAIATAASAAAVTNAALFNAILLANITLATTTSSLAIDTPTSTKAMASAYSALYSLQAFQVTADYVSSNATAVVTAAWLAMNIAYDQYIVASPLVIPQIIPTTMAIQAALIATQYVAQASNQTNLIAQATSKAIAGAVANSVASLAISNAKLQQSKSQCISASQNARSMKKAQAMACKLPQTKAAKVAQCSDAVIQLKVASSGQVQACSN